MTKNISFQKLSLFAAMLLVFAMACSCSNQADTEEAQQKITEPEQQEKATDGVEDKKATPCAHHAGTRSTPCAHHLDDKSKSAPCAHHSDTRSTPCSHHARPTRPSETE